MNGYIVLESGEVYKGRWLGGESKAGEVVFNTSHNGYEEIGSDPSYFNQIMVMTAPMQGNYGINETHRESNHLHISGFVALEIQNSKRDSEWVDSLTSQNIPVISEIDTRRLTLRLREGGTPWGAAVKAGSATEALDISAALIKEAKNHEPDWAFRVSRPSAESFMGNIENGPKVAVIDFGVKKNIIKELLKRTSQVKIFPSRVKSEEIKAYAPDGILLSNGPGDPNDVEVSVQTIEELLGWRPVFGICMGHQLLCRALGGKTFKLKFGHRGGNHPVKDDLLGRIYMTSQNHGYAVDESSLPDGIQISHLNLYDKTIEGINYPEKKCFSVQFHPESSPGPNDSKGLFDYFVESLR